MTIIKNIFLYLRHISFIAFLYAAVLIYPGLVSKKIGILCLIMLIIYTLITFIMFFIKSSEEEYNIFNNIVVIILHTYFSFVAYRYTCNSGLDFINSSFFSLNYLISAMSMLVLSFNKILLIYSK